MAKRQGLTLIEVIVVIIALLIILMLMLMASARRRPPFRGPYCLNNLKQLTLAWSFYVDENDDRIVNGAAGIYRPSGPPWVGKDWPDDYKEGGMLDPNEQIKAIRTGLLFPYVKNVRVYRCGAGLQGQMRTYSIVDPLNGLPQPGNPAGRGPKQAIDKLISKKRSRIRPPHARAVFVDVGWAAPGSFAVYYDKAKWWDPPPAHHGTGMAVSFADCHAEYWKWQGMETIKLGKLKDLTGLRQHIAPKNGRGQEGFAEGSDSRVGKVGLQIK